MTRRAFGFPDPLQDARRVRTAQVLSEAVANSSVTGSIGLENKIYLWPAKGETLSTYEPNATGLSDALTAAEDGSAVILPSTRIDLTDGITIPIGVTVSGLSREGSILSFSGLNNESAITHSARTTLEHLTVIVDGTQPLVGVDARAAKARVRHVAVTMASHANNVKIWAGYPEGT